MGSWYATDALTQHPITWREPVKCFILSKGRSAYGDIGSGFCYPTDTCEPFYLPLIGLYNDYGSLEKITEDFNTELIVQHFKNLHKENRLVFNDRSVALKEKMDFTIQSIIDFISQGFISYEEAWKSKYNPGHTSLHLMFVTDLNYQIALDLIKKEVTWNKKTYDQIVTDEEQELKKVYQETDPIKKMFKKDKSPWFKSFSNFTWEYELLPDYLETHAQDPYCFNKVKELVLFNHFMNRTRKFYSPQCGAGSQNRDYAILDNFYGLSILNRKEKERLDKEENQE